MKLPKLEELNSERFLNEAFDEDLRKTWIKKDRYRRNICLALFIISMLCVFYTAIIDHKTQCVVSLFLATVALVVMTKYDTQLHFLNILKKREEQKNDEPDHA